MIGQGGNHSREVRFFSFNTIYRYDIWVFYSIRYNILASEKTLLFEEFLANFQKFQRIF